MRNFISSGVSFDGASLVGIHNDRLVVDGPVRVQMFSMKDGYYKEVSVAAENNTVFSLRNSICSQDGNIYELDDGQLAKAICGEVRRGYALKHLRDDVYTREMAIVVKMMNENHIELLQKIGHKENPITELSLLQLISHENSYLCGQVDCVHINGQILSIMPYRGEDLYTLLKKKQKFSAEEVKKLFKNIVQCVESMQSLNICHRDLSLENILVNDEGECTIIDFGMALMVPKANKSTINSILKIFSDKNIKKDYLTDTQIFTSSICDEGGSNYDDDSSDDPFETLLMTPQGPCGKENYAPPEILANIEPFDGFMVDNWALGVILFMLFTGRPPFMRATFDDKWYRLIQKKCLHDILKICKIDCIPYDAVDLLDKLLKSTSYRNRYSTTDILAHSWVKHDA